MFHRQGKEWEWYGCLFISFSFFVCFVAAACFRWNVFPAERRSRSRNWKNQASVSLLCSGCNFLDKSFLFIFLKNNGPQHHLLQVMSKPAGMTALTPARKKNLQSNYVLSYFFPFSKMAYSHPEYTGFRHTHINAVKSGLSSLMV